MRLFSAIRWCVGIVRAAVPLTLVAVLCAGAFADDWPNWRGPNHNGISDEKGWTIDWPGGGPKVVWRASVGQGWSSVAIANGRAYTMGNGNNTDSVYCLDAATGKQIWKKSYRCAAGNHPGPRSTPTVDGNYVYTLSREGLLSCFDAATGRVKWARKLSARRPTWGLASSPLIHKGLVIVNTGSAGMAFNKSSGRPAWSTGNGTCGYASPVLYKSGSRTILLMFGAKALMGVSTRGRVGWSFPWETTHDVNAADPVVVGKRVFISSGYGSGCAMLSLGRGRPRQIWRNHGMSSHYGSPVLWKGALYGFDNGALCCLDAKTGRKKWSQGGIGKGGLILADGKLIVQSARGDLIIAEASPDGFKRLARARVLSGTCWTPPTLANGRIYCRSHEGNVVCVDVSADARTSNKHIDNVVKR